MYFCFLQVADEARYVATMKTVRQVKTVFVIFIAFVCCWSPYIVVLLYDNSDSLPLPVHLYASMLAHLHASLNFATYGLMNRSLRAYLLPTSCRQVMRTNVASAVAAAACGSCDGSHRPMNGRGALCSKAVAVSRSLLAVEYHQIQIQMEDTLQLVDMCHSEKIQPASFA